MSAIKDSTSVVVGACLWGTTGSVFALAPSSASSLSVGSMRLLVGAAGLMGIAASSGMRRSVNLFTHPPLYLAGLAMAAYQPLFFTGVDRTGVAVGTTIAIGSAPILTGLFAWISFGASPSIEWGRATVIAISGVAVLLLSAAVEPSLDFSGAVMCLGAGASYAVYAVATKSIAHLDTPQRIAATTFAIAALTLVPVLVTTDVSWLGTASGFAVAIWLGIGATTVAYLLFTSGLRRVTAPTAATLSLAEPVTAAGLAFVLLSERPPLPGWAGALLVAIGLGLMIRSARDQPS